MIGVGISAKPVGKIRIICSTVRELEVLRSGEITDDALGGNYVRWSGVSHKLGTLIHSIGYVWPSKGEVHEPAHQPLIIAHY